MSRPATPDPAVLLLAIAAGRLALHLPEAGLAPLTAPLGPAAALPEALVSAEDTLMAALAAGDAPLARLARAARLSALDLDLLGLALLPALDDRAAEAVEAIARGARRLTAGRAARLLLPAEHDASALRRALHESPLWRAGLLRAGDAGTAPGERKLDPTPSMLAVLDGVLPAATADGWVPRPIAAVPNGAGRLSSTVAAIRDWLEAPGAPVLVVESARAGRAFEALALAAAEAGRGALALHPASVAAPAPWAEAGVISAATGALVALVFEGDTPAGPGANPIGPVAAIGAETLLGSVAARRHLRVPPPRAAEQRARWCAARPDLPMAEADALSAQSWMSEADIAAIATATERPDPAGLLVARMSVAPPRAARLASLRTPAVPWDRLVLDAATTARLDDLVRRVRHRATVRDAWGMDSGGAALVALLTGDPGTGKTLAAEAVALRLGLPLLAADLSRVVSKYIGETEKNLAELFAAAEGFAALLFFDEADALFGKRTSVQDAHDRYANIEVNYLLQRLERFEGAVLLATNLADGMDEAFARRFDLIIRFRRPGPAQRLALWQAHLPAGVIEPGLDLNALAASCEVTGGEIRNAALTAAYAAAEAGTPIGAVALRAAVAQEFAKTGRPLPPALRSA